MRVVLLCALLLCLNVNAEAPANKPQTPVGPVPYIVEAVVVPVEDKVMVHGTLTVPEGSGPFPAAILLSVAGPADRNQTLGDHVGFNVLADYLTRQGIVVLRLDDRDVGESGGDYFSTSWEMLANDAIEMTQWLRGDPRVAPDAIGFIGMSQGAAIGAMAAERAGAAFVVLLSPPGLSGREALSQQLETTLAMGGIEGEHADGYRRHFSDFMDLVVDPSADGEARLRSFLVGPGRALVPAYGFVPQDLDGQIAMFRGAWYRSTVLFDPTVAYGNLHGPVLLIGGGKDFVSPPGVHLQAIRELLPDSAALESHVVEDGNHLLQASVTGLPQEYAQLPNSVHPRVLELVARWVRRYSSSYRPAGNE